MVGGLVAMVAVSAAEAARREQVTMAEVVMGGESTAAVREVAKPL